MVLRTEREVNAKIDPRRYLHDTSYLRGFQGFVALEHPCCLNFVIDGGWQVTADEIYRSCSSFLLKMGHLTKHETNIGTTRTNEPFP